MRIRLVGLPEEVKEGMERVGKVFDVVQSSRVMPVRGNSRLVRVYIEVRL
jgi:hypothetical protein